VQPAAASCSDPSVGRSGTNDAAVSSGLAIGHRVPDPGRFLTGASDGNPTVDLDGRDGARRFPATLRVLADVRAFVRSSLDGFADGDTLDVATLLADELATNAVEHARSEFLVAVTCVDHHLRVEVADRSTTAPVPGRPTPGDDSGRGLLLVDEWSDRWGVTDRGDGKIVWFELRASRRRRGVPG
jgi:anti-sigma regulatory factor (Ser/Thr protein kinase)